MHGCMFQLQSDLVRSPGSTKFPFPAERLLLTTPSIPQDSSYLCYTLPEQEISAGDDAVSAKTYTFTASDFRTSARSEMTDLIFGNDGFLFRLGSSILFSPRCPAARTCYATMALCLTLSISQQLSGTPRTGTAGD